MSILLAILFIGVALGNDMEPKGHVFENGGYRGMLRNLVKHEARDPTIQLQTQYHPYFTFMQIDTAEGFFRCGGSLIHADIVLTSAHCLVDIEQNEVENLTIIANLSTWDDISSSSRRQLSMALSHPLYNEDTAENDVMLLLLDEPLLDIEPVPLGFQAHQLSTRRQSYVPLLSDEQDESVSVLQELEVNEVNIDQCNSEQAYNGLVLRETMMCAASDEKGKDACQGDSGGPLLTQDVSGAKVQIGIVSFGFGCGIPGYPGVYTRVDAYHDFITDGICLLSNIPPQDCLQEIKV